MTTKQTKTKSARKPRAESAAVRKAAPAATVRAPVAKAETAETKSRRKRERAFPYVRILIGDMVLGPGKVDLLDAIGRTGSISAAGRELGMSYRRAWLLVDALNHMFPEAVVSAAPGGARGGGAKLTDYGRGVAAAYRRVEARARTAMREEMAAFNVLIDPD